MVNYGGSIDLIDKASYKLDMLTEFLCSIQKGLELTETGVSGLAEVLIDITSHIEDARAIIAEGCNQV